MDNISYLTPNIADSSNTLEDPLFSRLIKSLHEIKQARAGAGQWTGIVNGFSQKGVKAAEIEDSGILAYLSAQDPAAKIDKEELISNAARQLPRIKCVDLGSPQFPGYRNIDSSGSRYSERLYILSSEGMQADDAIEDLLYRIEDLGFNPGPLITDPGIVDRLEAQMKLLKKSRPTMFDFSAHHFSKVVEKHGKNLMAHARTSVGDGLFFVEEIQSDWAQRGRANNWGPNYPKAPFVVNTEQWAGVVLRDLMHTAAMDPTCTRFAWINATMRNGWAAASSGDDLQVFYATIIKKMAEKCIEKAGGRVLPTEILTKNGLKSVLGFEITPQVRDALKKALPMYSREGVLPRSVALEDPERHLEREQVVKECKSMLGQAHTIRFVARLYDISQSNEVAGQYLNQGITLSLRARSLNRAARHEAWHFAHENFLFPHEKREMRLAFAFGGDLNSRTQEALRAIGATEAAAQCVSEKECIAHAFSLWCEGRLEVADTKPKSIFEAVAKALSTMADWLEEKVFGVRVQSPEELFKAMRDGALALRQAATLEEAAPVPGA